MTTDTTPRLLRAVGLAGLTAIALNGVVGSGIFVLPATVYALAGAASPIAYLVVALLMALVVACFSCSGISRPWIDVTARSIEPSMWG